ncbi:MAG: NAD(P)H-dependent oxidoreductase [Burkholderiales bacterium]|nr:NAD(P)H-dependent oxidoreductase [Burkholderiales bacterium]
MTPRLLAFAGSLRTESLNKKLARAGADYARAAGADVEFIDLRDFPLPLFDEDLETAEGLPPNARRLKDLLISHHGFLLSCPEYNGSIPGVLKNAFDWISRQHGDESGLVPYDGKVVALCSASPGQFAALRSLETTRNTLIHLGCWVVPKRVAVPKAHEVFAPDGTLKDDHFRKQLELVAQTLVRTVRALHT